MSFFANITSTTFSAANTAFSTNSSSSTASIFSPAIILVALSCLTLAMQKLKPKERVGCPLPPGPKPLPLIGCLHWIAVNKPAFRWIHHMMDAMNTGIACIWLGRVCVITVTCPELAQEFLRSQDRIFASRPVHMSTELAGYGYLTTTLTPFGEQWKKMRRVITSEVLSLQRHRLLQNKRIEEADHVIRYMYNLCSNDSSLTTGGGIVNVRAVTRHYCGNVIKKLMFNKRFFGKETIDGGPGPEEIEHVDALFKILAHVNAFSISDYVPWLRLFDLDGQENILCKALECIRKYNDPEIDERIHMWRNGIKKEEEDILDVLILLTDSNKAPLLTPSEIKAQILDLMLAAVDNPSNATEWALAEMINEPNMLQRAVEELDKVVGRDRLVQESDLQKLNYVKACAREAFRLHPVAAFNVPHVSIADTNVADYYIPKGSQVLISRINLGRNPKIWEEPLKFKPERHLNADGSEVVLTDPKLRLLSFSTGRRGCPGVLLGSTMTVMLLARLIHGFTWSSPPNVSSISLIESQHDLTLSTLLLALAKPRLSKNVMYPMHQDKNIFKNYEEVADGNKVQMGNSDVAKVFGK